MKTIWNCYSRGIKGGGAITESTTSGGGHSDTTPAGGGHTSGPSSAVTTTTDPEGIEIKYSRYRPEDPITPRHTSTISMGWGDQNPATNSAGSHDHGGTTHPGPGDHEHSIWAHGQHQHNVNIEHTHRLYDHSHYAEISGHNHGMSHTHAVGDHSHSYSVPAHTHTIELPDHTHEIEFGIFEGPTPTAVTVKVDGNEIPDAPLSAEALDIVDYLKKDESGKIVRGWHEIEFIPNGLGRVEASLHIQLFIQSRGGGDY